MYFQLGFPTRYTLEDTPEGLALAKELVDENNGVTRVFKSIYKYDGYPSARTAVIDKLFFDFDHNPNDPEEALEGLRKLHEYLKKKNYEHSMFFSGNGFHLFLSTEKRYSREFFTPAAVTRRAHEFICKDAGIAPDEKTKDLMRFARVPNTINLKTGLFCIPLSPNMIYWSRGKILKRAKRQRFTFGVEPGDLFKISKFDVQTHKVKYAEPIGDVSDDIEGDELPLCVVNSLKDGYCGYKERYAIITALRDMGYTRGETKDILKKYLDPQKYEHCVKQEDQVNYLYDHLHLLFPSCYNQKKDGYCIKGCPGNKLYIMK
jgi:hypothetical protein